MVASDIFAIIRNLLDLTFLLKICQNHLTSILYKRYKPNTCCKYMQQFNLQPCTVILFPTSQLDSILLYRVDDIHPLFTACYCMFLQFSKPSPIQTFVADDISLTSHIKLKCIANSNFIFLLGSFENI